MKKALKYTLATLAAASLVAPVYAFNGVNVNNFAFSAAATYTEASNNGLHMGNSVLSGTAGAPITLRPIFLEPDHEWDYTLGLTYRLPNSDTRFFLDYDHYRGSEDRRAFGINALLQAPSVHTDGYVKHKDHNFKLGLKRTLEFGSQFEMVYGAGFEWAKVERNFTVSAVDAGGTHHRASYDEAEGWGPYVDVLGRAYPFNNNRCWSVFAHAGLGLLYADNSPYVDYIEDGVRPATGLNIQPEETTSIITHVEADLGVEWNRVMRADFADMRLGMRLGLKYLNYINAFKNGNLYQWPASGLHANLNTSPDDYGRMGAFLQFTLGGANS